MLIGRGVPPILGVVAIALLVVAAFIGGCGGEEASDSSSEEVAEQDVAEQDVAEQKTETAEEPEASVGDTVSIGNVQWTVTEVLRSDILVSRLGIEEGDYVIVDVDFRNNSNQDIRLATPFVTLLDGQGREYEADIEFNFLHVYASENMFVDQVNPGASKEGKIIFTVEDPDASGFKLQVGEARFASNEIASIDLGI
jgi:hypothetical protein